MSGTFFQNEEFQSGRDEYMPIIQQPSSIESYSMLENINDLTYVIDAMKRDEITASFIPLHVEEVVNKRIQHERQIVVDQVMKQLNNDRLTFLHEIGNQNAEISKIKRRQRQHQHQRTVLSTSTIDSNDYSNSDIDTTTDAVSSPKSFYHSSSRKGEERRNGHSSQAKPHDRLAEALQLVTPITAVRRSANNRHQSIETIAPNKTSRNLFSPLQQAQHAQQMTRLQHDHKPPCIPHTVDVPVPESNAETDTDLGTDSPVAQSKFPSNLPQPHSTTSRIVARSSSSNHSLSPKLIKPALETAMSYDRYTLDLQESLQLQVDINKELARQLDESQSRIVSLEAEINAEKNTVSSYAEAYDSHKLHYKRLELNYESVCNQLSESEGLRKAEISEIQDELSQYKNLCTELEQMKEQLLKERKEARSACEALEARCQALQDTLTIQSENFASVSQRIGQNTPPSGRQYYQAQNTLYNQNGEARSSKSPHSKFISGPNYCGNLCSEAVSNTLVALGEVSREVDDELYLERCRLLHKIRDQNSLLKMQAELKSLIPDSVNFKCEHGEFGTANMFVTGNNTKFEKQLLLMKESMQKERTVAERLAKLNENLGVKLEKSISELQAAADKNQLLVHKLNEAGRHIECLRGVITKRNITPSTIGQQRSNQQQSNTSHLHNLSKSLCRNHSSKVPVMEEELSSVSGLDYHDTGTVTTPALTTATATAIASRVDTLNEQELRVEFESRLASLSQEHDKQKQLSARLHQQDATTINHLSNRLAELMELHEKSMSMTAASSPVYPNRSANIQPQQIALDPIPNRGTDASTNTTINIRGTIPIMESFGLQESHVSNSTYTQTIPTQSSSQSTQTSLNLSIPATNSSVPKPNESAFIVPLTEMQSELQQLRLLVKVQQESFSSEGEKFTALMTRIMSILPHVSSRTPRNKETAPRQVNEGAVAADTASGDIALMVGLYHALREAGMLPEAIVNRFIESPLFNSFPPVNVKPLIGVSDEADTEDDNGTRNSAVLSAHQNLVQLLKHYQELQILEKERHSGDNSITGSSEPPALHSKKKALSLQIQLSRSEADRLALELRHREMAIRHESELTLFKEENESLRKLIEKLLREELEAIQKSRRFGGEVRDESRHLKSESGSESVNESSHSRCSQNKNNIGESYNDFSIDTDYSQNDSGGSFEELSEEVLLEANILHEGSGSDVKTKFKDNTNTLTVPYTESLQSVNGVDKSETVWIDTSSEDMPT